MAQDKELKAIAAISRILDSLTPEGRKRVLAYTNARTTEPAASNGTSGGDAQLNWVEGAVR